jgi:hypothetical protein
LQPGLALRIGVRRAAAATITNILRKYLDDAGDLQGDKRREDTVKRGVVYAIAVMFVGPAFAADATGNAALSLAALVGQHSPTLTPREKRLLSAYLEGRPKSDYPPGKKVVVRADEATCRISDVDITAKSCDLKFGARAVSFGGRQAQELYATLIEAGVPSSGAAGSIYESVKALACTIDPAAVREEGGGGANCTFIVNQ